MEGIISRRSLGKALWRMRLEAGIETPERMSEVLTNEAGYPLSDTCVRNYERGLCKVPFAYICTFAELVEPSNPLKVIRELYWEGRGR